MKDQGIDSFHVTFSSPLCSCAGTRPRWSAYLQTTQISRPCQPTTQISLGSERYLRTSLAAAFEKKLESHKHLYAIAQGMGGVVSFPAMCQWAINASLTPARFLSPLEGSLTQMNLVCSWTSSACRQRIRSWKQSCRSRRGSEFHKKSPRNCKKGPRCGPWDHFYSSDGLILVYLVLQLRRDGDSHFDGSIY